METAYTATDFSDHAVWRLFLTLGIKELHDVFYDTLRKRFVPYSSRVWQCDAADVLKNIEDAVYEDSLLLDDYDTSILIRPRATLLLPPGDVDMADGQALAEAIGYVDAAKQKDVWAEPVGEAVAVYSTPKGVRDFLSRSFLTEDVHHVLKPVIEHKSAKARSEHGEKMWVNLENGRLDVAAFRDGALLLANSWNFAYPADAAYYLLYAWDTLGMDRAGGEMRVSGHESVRREIMPMLRRYINYVGLTVYSTTVAKAVRDNVSLPQVLCGISQ